LNREAFFKADKGKIYPWVKVKVAEDDPSGMENVYEVIGDENPIFRNWLGDLLIMYAFDMGDRFQILMRRDLPKSIREDELHSIAVNNLNRDIEFKLRDTNFGGYMLTAGGDHEADSICLPGMWQWLADHIGDSLIVAIPAKDLVLIAPKSDTDKIDNLKIFVHEIFKSGERLLTRNIFEYNRDAAEWKIVDRVT
jgi:uncharacterized protein YtpQ (UPF0354 family)